MPQHLRLIKLYLRISNVRVAIHWFDQIRQTISVGGMSDEGKGKWNTNLRRCLLSPGAPRPKSVLNSPKTTPLLTVLNSTLSWSRARRHGVVLVRLADPLMELNNVSGIPIPRLCGKIIAMRVRTDLVQNARFLSKQDTL
jgi:hypothetical protein